MGSFSNQGSSVDTFLDSAQATTNHGTEANINVGHTGTSTYRGLIKWDLTSIPSVATVLSATLSLYIVSDASTNTRVLSAYRVKRAWTEAGATWNTYDGSNGWGTVGCANTTSDREATDIGTVSVAGDATGEKQISLTASAVQEWISGAMTNNGVLLQVATENEDCMVYGAHENGTSGSRPKLVIQYSTGGIIHWQIL